MSRPPPPLQLGIALVVAPPSPDHGNGGVSSARLDAPDSRSATIDFPAADWRDLVSMAASTVIHVVILLLMVMIAPALKSDSAGPPVQIVSAVEEEPLDVDDADMIPIEMPEERPEDFEQPLVELPNEIEVSETADFDVEGGGDVDAAAAFAGPLSDLAAGADAILAEFATVRAGGGDDGRAGGGFGGEIGRRLARAGAQSGAIQVSLAWNNFNDLDLHVIPPSRDHIFFGHRISRCGGHLDIDMNAGGQMSGEPVENVFWPRRTAPHGEFAVYVHHFARHDSIDETPFEVHLLVDGVKQSFKGIARSGGPPQQVTSFQRRPGAGREAPTDTFPE